MHRNIRATARALARPHFLPRTFQLRVEMIGFMLAFLIAMSPQLVAAEADAVRHLLMRTFDLPESPLTVDPVTMEGDIAIAGWAQGEMGGRALLRKQEGAWRIVLCSGDALTEAGALRQFGLTASEASAMAAAVVAAEAELDPMLVEKFSRFDGVMRMDAEGGHPPVDTQGHAPAHGEPPHTLSETGQ